MNKMKSVLRKLQYKRGVTLLFSILLVSFFLIVGFGIINLATQELNLSGTGKASQVAYYAAESGAECARYWDIVSQSFGSGAAGSPATPGEIQCKGNSILPGWTSVTDPSDPNVTTTNLTIEVLTSDGNTTQAEVKVVRNNATGLVKITSKGRNRATGRRVEREVYLEYTSGLCATKSDSMLLLDISGSVGNNGIPSEIDLLKAAAKQMISILDPAPADSNDTHVGLVPFGSRPFFTNHLNALPNELDAIIDSISVDGTRGTNIPAAIAVARNELKGWITDEVETTIDGDTAGLVEDMSPDGVDTHQRPAHPKFIILVTDGASHNMVCDSTKSGTCVGGDTDGMLGQTGAEGAGIHLASAEWEARKAKNDDIVIYTIGIGVNSVFCGNLNGATGNREFLSFVSNRDEVVTNCEQFLEDHIASEPSKCYGGKCAYTVDDFDELATEIPKFFGNCGGGVTTPPTTGQLPITNAGFESPTLSEGAQSSYANNVSEIPGWAWDDYIEDHSAGVDNLEEYGVVYNIPGAAPEGSNVAKMFSSGNGSEGTYGGRIKQVLSATLQPNTRYTLSATINGDGSSEVIRLSVGSETLSYTWRWSPYPGGFHIITTVYESPASSPLIGQPLSVSLEFSGGTGYFDDVKLFAEEI